MRRRLSTCWSQASRRPPRCRRVNASRSEARSPQTLPMHVIALYPGSFDPVTNGHVDVVRHAARLAGRLVIAIGVHPGKAPLFSADERIAMLEETCGATVREAGCEFACITFDDLAVSAARRVGATIMVRGLRDATDLDYEMQLAGMNAPWRPRCRQCSC